MDRPWADVIDEHPIGDRLDGFRASFRSSGASLEQLGRDELRNLLIMLLSVLQPLPAARILRSTGGKSLLIEMLQLSAAILSDDFDFDRVRPLLKKVMDEADDSAIWDQLKSAVTEVTPPPRLPSSLMLQTPGVRNTSSFANSSEYRKHVDGVLKEELGLMYVGLPGFWDAYFGGIDNLETASEAFFQHCVGGPTLLFENGWTGWPADAREDGVLDWFSSFCERLAVFAADQRPGPSGDRRPLAKPNKPIDGSVGVRKMDIGFVSSPNAQKNTKCHWSRILVPGELKSNPSADKPAAWLDLGRYAREVLAAQDTRRFVLGFTICGSLMRIWAFDRLGGIASEQFDVNQDGQRFVFAVLGFLWMSEEQLGFDPTIRTENDERFIDIDRDGSKQRVIIDEVMLRARCIAGRATTCWRAHPEGHPEMRLVIKDSWQYPERDEEGEMLQEMTSEGVVNVARYYHHETVRVGGVDDDVRNIRKGLDVATASNYESKGASEGRKSTSRKRPFSQTDSVLPLSKRSSASPNRVHRRVIVMDCGKPIYKASSRPAMLAAFRGCIKGLESLREAGVIHRDVSINNLMIDEDNPASSCLIDLDLAVREDRMGPSGAKGKTGTRAFMAIGALLGERHTFMHDLESIFWVLFWVCIHYGADGATGPTEFDSWNYESDNQLVRLKVGTISSESIFLKIVEESFTPYHQPLIPWVNRLRRSVFPNGEMWNRLEPELFSSMGSILDQGERDPAVAAPP